MLPTDPLPTATHLSIHSLSLLICHFFSVLTLFTFRTIHFSLSTFVGYTYCFLSMAIDTNSYLQFIIQYLYIYLHHFFMFSIFFLLHSRFFYLDHRSLTHCLSIYSFPASNSLFLSLSLSFEENYYRADDRVIVTQGLVEWKFFVVILCLAKLPIR